jgi:hypothetical protein
VHALRADGRHRRIECLAVRARALQLDEVRRGERVVIAARDGVDRPAERHAGALAKAGVVLGEERRDEALVAADDGAERLVEAQARAAPGRSRSP